MKFEIVPEKDGSGGWRVEALVGPPDGCVLCASFWGGDGGGGDAEWRARDYAEWMNSRYGNQSKAPAA